MTSVIAPIKDTESNQGTVTGTAAATGTATGTATGITSGAGPKGVLKPKITLTPTFPSKAIPSSGPNVPNVPNVPNTLPRLPTSLKQTKPIATPKPPIIVKPKAKEVRICLPSMTEIYASIYNEIHKRVIDTISDIFDKVADDYKLDSEELREKYLKDLKIVLEKNQEEVKKIGVPTVRKPRTVLDTGIRCMARTANGSQCTRRKQKDETGEEYDFCGSHKSNQPNGKISDPPLVIAEKKKRGRPPKKTVLMDGTIIETSENHSEDSVNGSNLAEDALESPYDDTASVDCFEINDGDHSYICNRNTNIVYESPADSQINDINDLTRVGMWEAEQGVIVYDN